jgi:hypothetical protein
LLNKAIAIKSASELAQLFNIVLRTILNASAKGKLSTTIAGKFAIELGKDLTQWMIATMMENEREALLIDRLCAAKPEWRKLSLSDNNPRRQSLTERRGRRFLNAIHRAFYDAGRAAKNLCEVSQAVKALAV